MRRAKQLCEQFSRHREAFLFSPHSREGLVAIRGVQPVCRGIPESIGRMGISLGGACQKSGRREARPGALMNLTVNPAAD